MKRLKYISLLTLIFGSIAFSCNEDLVSPLGTGDEDEDPVGNPPPPPPAQQNTVPLDSLNG